MSERKAMQGSACPVCGQTLYFGTANGAPVHTWGGWFEAHCLKCGWDGRTSLPSRAEREAAEAAAKKVIDYPVAEVLCNSDISDPTGVRCWIVYKGSFFADVPSSSVPMSHYLYSCRDQLRSLSEARRLAEQVAGFLCGLDAWQPIETAPKDGTAVLLFSAQAHQSEKFTTGYWNGSWWQLCQTGTNADDGEVCPMPTHWMPLPGPPATQGETP